MGIQAVAPWAALAFHGAVWVGGYLSAPASPPTPSCNQKAEPPSLHIRKHAASPSHRLAFSALAKGAREGLWD